MNDQYYYSIESDCDACITSFVEELKNFQAQLTDGQEMMITVNDCSFRLERLRHEHNTIMYYGSRADNTSVVLVQHYRQLNVSFFAVPKRKAEGAPVRIGFVQG